MNAIILRIKSSSTQGRFDLQREDGTRATIDEAIREGFRVTDDDSACLLSLAAAHVEAREAMHP